MESPAMDHFRVENLGISFGGDIGVFITAFIGAVLLLAIIGLIKRA